VESGDRKFRKGADASADAVGNCHRARDGVNVFGCRPVHRDLGDSDPV